MTLRLLRFFLEADGLPIRVEFDYAVTLRVAYLISENASATLNGQRISVKVEFSVENVVTQNE